MNSSASQQTTPTSLKGATSGYRSSIEYNAGRLKGVFMPAPTPYDLTSGSQSQSSSMMGSEEEQRDSHPLIGCSMDNVDEKQVL